MGFAEDLKLIIDVHNTIRGKLFTIPGPEAHFINENTVLRLYALLEAYECPIPKRDDLDLSSITEAEIAVRTLAYIRNLIPHGDHGLFRTCKKSHYLSSFKRFAEKHPDIMVSDGEPICLAVDEVLTPLVNGLIEWAKENGKWLPLDKE